MGRPTKYSEDIARDICFKLAEGKTLSSICRDDKMPSRSSVYLWRVEIPEFSDKFARARDVGFDAIADETVEIADDKTDDPASRRVRVQTRLDLLGRWSTRYSTKTETKHSGEVVNRHDLSNLSDEELEAFERLAAKSTVVAGDTSGAVKAESGSLH